MRRPRPGPPPLLRGQPGPRAAPRAPGEKPAERLAGPVFWLFKGGSRLAASLGFGAPPCPPLRRRGPRRLPGEPVLRAGPRQQLTPLGWCSRGPRCPAGCPSFSRARGSSRNLYCHSLGQCLAFVPRALAVILPWNSFPLRYESGQGELAPEPPGPSTVEAQQWNPRDGTNEIKFAVCSPPFLWFVPPFLFHFELILKHGKLGAPLRSLPQALFLLKAWSSRVTRPKRLYKKASPYPSSALPGHSTPLQPWQQRWRRRGAGPT